VAPPPQPCTKWNQTTGGYLEACGGSSGNEYCFSGVSLTDAQNQCCNDVDCAGFSYDPSPSQMSGCYKTNTDCGFVSNPNYVGYYKPSFQPPTGPANITVMFNEVGFSGSVKVRDIWAQKDLGVFTGSYTAINVPFHGTAFLRLSQATSAEE